MHTNSLPIIKATTGKIEFNALTDTGSSINVISPLLFEKIKNDQKIKYIAKSCQVLTMTGEQINYRCVIELKFAIGNQKITHEFFVTRQPFSDQYECILGYNLFKKFNTQINLEGGYIRLNNTKVPIFHTQSEADEINNIKYLEFPVSLKKKVTIKPAHDLIVELSLRNNNLPEETQVFFEPKNLKNGLALENSVTVVENNAIRVIISNKSLQNIALNKKMNLGYVSTNFEICDDMTKNNTEQVNLITASNDIKRLREEEFNIDDFNFSHLASDEKIIFQNLVKNNKQVFSKSLKTLGHTDLIRPEIQLNSDLPVASKPYSIPFAMRQDAKNLLNEFLEAGLITTTKSNYAAPVLFVKKRSSNENKTTKNGLRLANDMRLLNAFTVPFPVKPPRVTDILYKLSGEKYFSTLDLKEAFMQLNLPTDMREKFAFSSLFGNFQHNRLCYGWCNSPGYFLTLINECLKDVGPGIFWYLDDVIVVGKDAYQMAERIQKVFDAFKKNNMTISPTKGKFMQTQIDFLGYNISQNGIQPIDKNIKKIVAFELPKTRKQLKSFLATCSFYRALIANYSEIAGCLEQMTSEKRPFIWNEKTKQHFNMLQQKFLDRPIAMQPDFNKKFFLITDASKNAIAGYLAQYYDKTLKPVAFFSKALSNTQMKYPAIKLELFAIVESVKHFREFLFDEFTILTDHKSLIYHKKLESPPSIICNWILYLQNFNFSIRHIPGKENKLADYLSRYEMIKSMPDFEVTSDSTLGADGKKTHVEGIVSAVTTRHMNRASKGDQSNETTEVRPLRVEREPLSVDVLLREQLQDVQIRNLKETLQSDNLLTKNSDLEYYVDPKTDLVMRLVQIKNGENKNIIKEVTVVPKSLQLRVIDEVHKTHSGIEKSYGFLKEHYFFKGMYSTLKSYILSCHQCLTNKPSRQKSIPSGRLPQPGRVLHYVYTDITGPLDNGKYVLTLLDSFSRFLEAYILTNISAEAVAKKLVLYCTTYGPPEYLVCDNGTQFTSRLVHLIGESFGTKTVHILTYAPFQNPVERCHSQLKVALTTLVNSRTADLENSLQLAKHFYNASKHPRLGKYCPYFVFFGREINKIFDPLNEVSLKNEYTLPQYLNKLRKTNAALRKIIPKNQLRFKEKIERQSEKKSVKRHFEKGDLVYVKTPGGFKHKFEGPWQILAVKSQSTIQITNGVRKQFISTARTKLIKRKHATIRKRNLQHER